MTDDPKIAATKRSIARALSQGELEHNQLFEKVNADIGSGKVVFEGALNEMVGAHEVDRKRKPKSVRGRIYGLLGGGKRWLP